MNDLSWAGRFRAPARSITVRTDVFSICPTVGCSARRHGDAWAYHNYGCRCPAAREAWRVYAKRRREGRLPAALVPALGTVRRLRALMALGWPSPQLAGRTGMATEQVLRLVAGGRERVRRGTAAAVARLYDELSMRPGPSTRTRLRATARGWMPPLAWDEDSLDDPAAVPVATPARSSRVDVDEVVVDRLAAQQPVASATIAERREAVAKLHAAGVNDRQIAARTGLAARTVLRIRAELGLAPVVPRGREGAA